MPDWLKDVGVVGVFVVFAFGMMKLFLNALAARDKVLANRDEAMKEVSNSFQETVTRISDDWKEGAAACHEVSQGATAALSASTEVIRESTAAQKTNTRVLEDVERVLKKSLNGE